MTELSDLMADGIGDVHFASAEWVAIAKAEMATLARNYDLTDVSFTLCEVGHNAPAYLKAGGSLAWHARIANGEITVAEGEIPTGDCDLKMACDHSVISNIGRIVYEGNDPAATGAAVERLSRLTRWERHGEMPQASNLQQLFSRFHDVMAPRTMPRFVWMSPDWVEVVRRFLIARATSDKYRDGLKGINYLFAEEFHETPRYAFKDGEIAGFWVDCRDGDLTVGYGAYPDAEKVADGFTRGLYNAVLPVGRTVEANMNDEDNAEKAEYAKTAFRFDKARNRRAVEQSSPSGKGNMPPALARVFMPLHDEISKRTSGELPGDYEGSGATALKFDRDADYDPAWLRYNKVDIYGHSLSDK